jgi:hypothetical protein
VSAHFPVFHHQPYVAREGIEPSTHRFTASATPSVLALCGVRVAFGTRALIRRRALPSTVYRPNMPVSAPLFSYYSVVYIQLYLLNLYIVCRGSVGDQFTNSVKGGTTRTAYDLTFLETRLTH